MSHLRFNHVFLFLLLGSALCAFALPLEYANLVRGWGDGLLWPVALPVRHAAEALTHRMKDPADTASPGRGFDPKNAHPDARAEIEHLQAALAQATVQFRELQRLQKDRQLKGDVENYSLPCKVIGADAGTRDAISISGASGDGLAAGMPVVYRDCIVGKLAAVGGGGSQVRLITDRGFRVNGAFGRMKGTQFVPVVTETPLVEGRGGGVMTITNLTKKQVKDVQAGDRVLLQDSEDWPLMLNGYELGRVELIEDHPKQLQFAQITVRPRADLHRLREAMVVARKPDRPGTK